MNLVTGSVASFLLGLTPTGQCPQHRPTKQPSNNNAGRDSGQSYNNRGNRRAPLQGERDRRQDGGNKFSSSDGRERGTEEKTF
jgi:hypothetical protein